MGITLSNGDFLVKEGLLFQANTFIQKLYAFQKQTNSSTSNDMIISSALFDQHPILRNIIHMFENSSSQLNPFFNTFKYTIISTIISNHDRAKTRYSYNDFIRDFASCIFILGGRNAYEFIRINIPDFIPSLTIVQHLLDSTTSRIEEGEFRYNLMSDYLASQKTDLIFVAEDYTAVVPRIIHDIKANAFIGFTPLLENGIPKVNSFSTDSFSELESWFNTLTISNLLKLQMIQPINLNGLSSSSFVLSSYGTDNQFTTEDILMKWMNIVNQCNEKKVKVVGVSTDCDPRYLQSMRLFMGFFADMPNQQIHLRDDAFHVKIPKVISIF